MTQDQKTPKPPAASAPTASARRFLAQLMEYSFREGWRTPDDFVKHFPAEAMMTALKSAPELRVAILAAATGIYEEILRRKSPALAAEDLSLALDEGTTSSLQLLSVFSPEDRVRYLDPRKIWDLAEDQFWRFDPEAADEQRQDAADRMSFTLTQAVQERLLTLRDILDGLTYEAVADSLSPNELRTVVRHALLKGRDGIGLNEKVLLEVLPLDKLVRSMPLEHIWNEVVVRRLAIPSGLTDLEREGRRASQSERPMSEPPRWSTRPSAVPPPLPPELARPALPLPESRPLPPPAPPSQTFFQQNDAPSSRGFQQNDAPSSRGFQQNDAPSSRAPARDANGYPLNVAGTSDYTEEDNELTTAAPSVTSSRENSLLPPPMRPSAPPSSPSSATRGQLMDDFNHPLPPSALGGNYPGGVAGNYPGNFPGGVSLSQAALVQAGFGQAPPPSSRNAGPPPFEDPENTERQRQRVTEHLRAIGRLPPRHATMPAGVLRSIDAMYALLPSATDDIQRKSVIRQAFGNDNHLRVALLGLIELMDSSIDTSDTVIQEAKIEALIKILLFEEQRRKENGRFPAAPFSSQRLPSSLPPASAPTSSMASYDGRTAEGYYFPQQVTAPPPGGYGATHVATQRPPPPNLGNAPAYGGSQPPLPNLPPDSNPSRRRTMPPPLPPSYPRG